MFLFIFPVLILIGWGIAERSPKAVWIGLLSLLPVSGYLLATPYGHLALALLLVVQGGIVAAINKGRMTVAWGLYLALVVVFAGQFYWMLLTQLPSLSQPYR